MSDSNSIYDGQAKEYRLQFRKPLLQDFCLCQIVISCHIKVSPSGSKGQVDQNCPNNPCWSSNVSRKKLGLQEGCKNGSDHKVAQVEIVKMAPCDEQYLLVKFGVSWKMMSEPEGPRQTKIFRQNFGKFLKLHMCRLGQFWSKNKHFSTGSDQIFWET